MIAAIVAIVSLVTHFVMFGYPRAVVFDEVHNGNFLTNYWHGTYLFDLHPPLAKLIEVFFGYLTGANRALTDFTSIGNALPFSDILLRLIPLLSGIILPIIVYFLLRRIGLSKISAGLGSLLICLENSLLVQSRFVMFDIIMIADGFLALLIYLIYRQSTLANRRPYLLFLSIVLATIAFSIKWTGLTFLFLIVVMETYRLSLTRKKNQPWKIPAKTLSFFYLKTFLLAFILYISIFYIHFSLLPKSGPGDDFMSYEFQKTLVNNHVPAEAVVQTPGFMGKFLELNKVMYLASRNMTATHTYSSKWYTWPFMQRPIFYWQSKPPSPPAYIYLLGNPFIYWSGALSVLILILICLFHGLKYFKNLSTTRQRVGTFILVGYLVNWLPFILIGRVMFLYHYEIALIFSIMAIAFLLDFLKTKTRQIVALIIILVALGAFLYWSPLTYGLPLSDSQLQSRMWFSSWR